MLILTLRKCYRTKIKRCTSNVFKKLMDSDIQYDVINLYFAFEHR